MLCAGLGSARLPNPARRGRRRLPAAAATLRTSTAELGLRLERAGFAHLLRQDVLDAYRKAARTRAKS